MLSASVHIMISVFFSFILSCLVLSPLSSSLLCVSVLCLFSQSFSVFLLRVMWCVSLCVVIRSKSLRCVPTPRAHAEKHVRVLPAYTGGGVLNPHTEGRQLCLPRKAHVEFSLGPTDSPKKPLYFTHFSLRIDREQHLPDSSDHSLYLTKLLRSSYPGENVGGNQP